MSKLFKRGLVGFGLFSMAVVVFVLIVGPSDANAGGEGDLVAESTFTFRVEPIKMRVVDVKGTQMDPGGIASAKVEITNFSPKVDWAIAIDILVGETVSDFYDGALVEVSATWENGAIYNPDDVIVVPAGAIQTLLISLEALDGAGRGSIKVGLRRLWPVGIEDRSSLDTGIYRQSPSVADIETVALR